MEPDGFLLKILIRGEMSAITTVSFDDSSKYEQDLQSKKYVAIAPKSSCA